MNKQTSYNYTLSIGVCIKNESSYIIDFIKHYIEQGVEHFYIVNNNSDDNIEELIEIQNINLWLL